MNRILKGLTQTFAIAALLFVQACSDQGESTMANESTSESENRSPVEGVSFRFIESNGLNMRIAEIGAGEGRPLVLLAHGWPESWYSWRHQMTALADAGYHAVAPDMRGYGKTDKPADVDDYDIVHLAGDMVGVLDALGEETAVMVGHDWGSIVAWNTVLLYPERFSALIAMSVPYSGRAPQSPMVGWRETFGDNFYYILYHNEPGGVAEAEYDSNPYGLISRLYLSPDSPRETPLNRDPLRASGGWIDRLGAPVGLPDWLTQQDLDYVVAGFEESGFRGGVNYYRNFHRNWEITGSLQGAVVEVPTLFIAGEQDVVIAGASRGQLNGAMSRAATDLREVLLIPGIGHWVQQEAPEETNAAMLEFLESL
jgi:pimeloyl-ACP methyl ester carboxylesterase